MRMTVWKSGSCHSTSTYLFPRSPFPHKINPAHPRRKCPGKTNTISISHSLHFLNFPGQRIKLLHSISAVQFYVNLMFVISIMVCQKKNVAILSLPEHGKNLPILCSAGVSHGEIFSCAFRHSICQLPFMLYGMSKGFLSQNIPDITIFPTDFLSFNHHRIRLQPDYRSTGCKKFLQQLYRVCKQIAHPRNHNHLIAALSSHKQPIFHFSVLLQKDFISEIKIHMSRSQRFRYPVVILTLSIQRRNMLIQPSHIHFQMVEIFCPVTAALCPDAGNGVDHQHLPHRLSLGKAQGQTSKIIFHLIIIFPPGVLIVEHRRIIPLSASCNGIQGKVLTASGNSQRKLPVSQPFLSGKIQLPASAAVSLTDSHGAVILMCHTCTLLYCQILICLCAKKINSRVMQIAELRHRCSAHTSLIAQIVFV